MLELQEIDVYRGGGQVLEGVSLTARHGEVVAVLGRNGAGKSTTLRAAMGLSPIAAGQIRLAGEDVGAFPPHRRAAAGIALLPETRGVLASFSVRAALRLASNRRAGRWTRDSVLGLFPRLAERQAHRGDQLSGGEQQMLGIATALLLNPQVLLLDEPTHGLAPQLVAEIGRCITRIQAEGTAVVLVEQNFRFAARMASRAVVLGKGRVRWSGVMQDLLSDREVQSTWIGI